ncbi:MAG: hypothetical protein ABSA46_09735 [Thermodesulfovibrionales bacterium]
MNERPKALIEKVRKLHAVRKTKNRFDSDAWRTTKIRDGHGLGIGEHEVLVLYGSFLI